MGNEYLIVNKSILPENLEKVIEARKLIRMNKAVSVSEAVRIVGISRNTYYKYKDAVFEPDTAEYRRKANISIVLKHVPGSLSAVLSALSMAKVSVITISQSIPIADKASVTLSLDLSQSSHSPEELIHGLETIEQVFSARLDAVE